MNKYRFRYYLYKVFQFFFRYTPNIIIKYFLLLLSKLLFVFNKEHRFIADVNLNLAYNNSLTKEQKNNIVSKSYKSLMFNLFEYMENQYITKDKLVAKATITNENVILDAIKEKRKIIFVTAHYGGWELAIPYIALKYGTLAVVNKKMKNEYINNMYVEARDRNNIIMLDKKVAAKGMIKAFKNDHFVAIAIDQNTDNGVEIDFFGTKAMATDAPARLALKFDAVIIPVFAVCKGFREYELKIYDAIDPTSFKYKTEDKIQELTQKQHSVIEKQVRDIPEQWFWQHKRWKYHNPKLYESKYD
ncbi:MAG: lipid A biosynthesis lauroyl acyltransferase [Campylobacterota bacterium]|nr:lipid A biosynthesis lauroyl acyltransferase [Campylobacterota bacterium]